MALKRPEGLNVIPLIDVMLVLLAMVLIVSTFISQSHIQIDLPKASLLENETQKESFEVVINATNELFVKNHKISMEILQEKLSLLSIETPFILRADKESKFGLFIHIVDLLKAKGHENFQIMVENE